MDSTSIPEKTVENNLPELSPHLVDGFSLKQLEILHDYAVKAFVAGVEYAKKETLKESAND